VTCVASTTHSIPCIDLSGLRIASLPRDEVVDYVARALVRREGGWLLTATLDYVRRFATDASDRELFSKADLVVPDGVPLLWAARLQGNPLPDRVAGSDLVWLLAERAVREGRSIYLLGGEPGAAQEAVRRFLERWPSLRIAGASCPRLSAQPSTEELEGVRDRLELAQPDLVYVALGVPKQDRVIAALRADFPRIWWVGVGISLSFVSGSIQRAPHWMQRTGLEWLHRLAQEPRRLARRYLIDDLPFALRLLARSWRKRRRDAESSTSAPS
jgi:N-acetylglucosaminyldiphosphoundecaprenol N-acetyl-beta-D-mannosaminyltransferase